MSEDKKDVPYIVFEGALAREERHNKRLWFALIVVVSLWFLTIIGCIWYSTLPVETYSEITQEADDADGEIIQNVGDSYGESEAN